jgi:acetaldehyde dehydrogenase (acetylating)
LKFNGLGHTCGIYSRDDKRTREFAMRMPSMRVLCNTPTPQGSVGITTNLQPSMTLGCGAIAGNITGDNIGAKHLINIKRLAYSVRNAEEAFDMPVEESWAAAPARAAAAAASGVTASVKSQVSAAVERFLAERGLADMTRPPGPVKTNDIVDRFLSAKRPQSQPNPPSMAPACAAPAESPEVAQPPIEIADFVGEQEVRSAIQRASKIYIGPKTIVTPLARDLAAQHGTLVLTQTS